MVGSVVIEAGIETGIEAGIGTLDGVYTAGLGADIVCGCIIRFAGWDGSFFGSGQETRAYTIIAEETGGDRWRFRIEELVGDRRKVWIADAIPPELRHLTDAARIMSRLHDPSSENEPE